MRSLQKTSPPSRGSRRTLGPATRLGMVLGPTIVVSVVGRETVKKHPLASAFGAIAVALVGVYVDRQLVPRNPDLRAALEVANLFASRLTPTTRATW